MQCTLMGSAKAMLPYVDMPCDTHVPYCCTGMCRYGTQLAHPCWLLAGMSDAPSTVKVEGDTLRINLQSPVPDGAVTDFGEALQTRGSLKREPQGVIRTFEAFQLHLVYGWHVLLHQLRDLTKWWAPVQNAVQHSPVCSGLKPQSCHCAVHEGQQHGLM